jgi:K+-transporting ATPase KdpF subunit
MDLGSQWKRGPLGTAPTSTEPSGGIWHERFNVACVAVCPGDWGDGALSLVPESLRKDLKGAFKMMIFLTVAIVACLFVYLFTALIRPEWF